MTVTGPSSRSVRRPTVASTLHTLGYVTNALPYCSISTEMRLLLYRLSDTCHAATLTGVFRNSEHVVMGIVVQWSTRPLHSGPRKHLEKTNRVSSVAAKYTNMTVSNLFYKVQLVKPFLSNREASQQLNVHTYIHSFI